MSIELALADQHNWLNMLHIKMLPEDDNAGAAGPCEGGVSPSANRHHLGMESKDVDTGISHLLGPNPRVF